MARYQAISVHESNKLTEEHGVPLYIVALMLREMYYQTGLSDIKYLEGSYSNAFLWSETKKGFDFWYEVLILKRYELFFKEYFYAGTDANNDTISIVLDNDNVDVNHHTRGCVKNMVGVDNLVKDNPIDVEPQDECECEFIKYIDDFDFVKLE